MTPARTDYKDPDGKKWCSTRTSNHSRTRHVHVGHRGFWGHCPEECAEKEVGPCVDYARDGFGCVDAERCNDECEVIPVFLDGDELTENFNDSSSVARATRRARATTKSAARQFKNKIIINEVTRAFKPCKSGGMRFDSGNFCR